MHVDSVSDPSPFYFVTLGVNIYQKRRAANEQKQKESFTRQLSVKLFSGTRLII